VLCSIPAFSISLYRKNKAQGEQNGFIPFCALSVAKGMVIKMKKLIVFDLDGTLAESKSSIDNEMAGLLHDLLGTVKVAVISGGGWLQFEKQLLANLPHDEWHKNLFLLPTCKCNFKIFAFFTRIILPFISQKHNNCPLYHKISDGLYKNVKMLLPLQRLRKIEHTTITGSATFSAGNFHYHLFRLLT
jgi:hypothetical protein